MKYKLFFAQFLTLVMFLSACMPAQLGTQEQPAAETPATTPVPSAEARQFVFKIAAGSEVSDFYPFGYSLAELLSSKTRMQAGVQNTNSDMDSLRLLTSGKVGMAFGYDYQVILSNQGRLANIFPDAPSETLHIKCGVEITRPAFPDYSQPARIVAPLYEQVLLLVTTEKTGIARLVDLKGRRVSTGQADSAAEQQAGLLLTGLGMDLDQDITRVEEDVNQSPADLLAGKIDAFFWSGKEPKELSEKFTSSSSSKVMLIPITGSEAEKILAANPGYFHRTKLAAESIPGFDQADDVDTLAVTVVLIAMQDFPADHIYEISAVIFENAAVLPGSRAAANNLTAENSALLLTTEAKEFLHEGAKKYFSEEGILN